MTYGLVISACGLAVWLWFLAGGGRRALPRVEAPPVPWGGLETLFTTLFLVGALGGSGALMGYLAGAQAGGRLPVGYQVAAAALGNALTALLVLSVAARSGRRGMAALGLTSRPVLEQLLFGFVGFFAVLPLLVGFDLLFTRVLAPLFRYQPRRQEVVEMFIAGRWSVSYAAIVLYAVVAAPLAEEVIFRGFVQGYLGRLFGTRGTVFLSALLFSFFHQPVEAAAAVFFLGLVLAYQRERTRSLMAPVATHILFNLHTFITTQVMRA